MSKITNEIFDILKSFLKPQHLKDDIIAFIIKYIECRNTTQAAKHAGLTHADGRWLIQQTDIYGAIEKLTSDMVQKHGYDAAEIIERTKEIAFFDPADLVKPDGTYYENLKDVPPEARRAIKKLVSKNIYEDNEDGYPVYKGKLITMEFWDKPKTLELLAREKDTFKKTTVVEHDVSKNARQYLLASEALAKEDSLKLAAPLDNNTIDVTPVSETSVVIPVLRVNK